MKRNFLTLLLIVGAIACHRSGPESHTAREARHHESARVAHNAQETSVSRPLPAARETDMTVPEHRTSDALASSGELPDTTSRTNAASSGRTSAAPAVPHGANDGEAVAPGMNESERGSTDLTPMDQGETESDIQLTQEIRRSIIARDDLSFSARNVKIISRDGKVTLRGSVPNARERKLVEDTAQACAGVTSVENQLEISGK